MDVTESIQRAYILFNASKTTEGKGHDYMVEFFKILNSLGVCDAENYDEVMLEDYYEAEELMAKVGEWLADRKRILDYML